MSRIGKKPIEIPAGVKVSRDQSEIKVKGPKGELSAQVPEGVDIVIGEGSVTVNRLSDGRRDRSAHGLVRTIVSNMVTGVSNGFEKGLEISGVGYRAELSGNVLKMVLGYSSPAEYVIPEGISVKIDRQVNLVVSGIDKQLVGMVAAEIRGLKKPEPYKGKGIKYANERIRRKVGKSVGA
ncbi:MAG: 50S ribosomal protein L6 [Deltaproteobacteria bacterium]|nr:50S ribosomal protein L6 [Deltaproteobacteria bacterium]